MAEHAGGNPGLLDLRIFVHDAADPAQVDVERLDRPAADDDAGGRPVVRDRVENLARVLEPPTISIAGTTYSVARRTLASPTPGPFSGVPRMKASSISTRGRQ
jgi:hypothetical protein